MEPESNQIALDDWTIRLIGIPFFGLVIPSATGLVQLAGTPPLAIALHYAFFIFIAFAVWQGNRFLLFRNYPVIYNSQSLFQKYLLMVGLNIFYSAPLALMLLFGWKWAAHMDGVTGSQLLNTTVLIVVCVIFVTNIYEKALYGKQIEMENVKVEQLERARVQAELEALKNQIDPHFMFNALNSISFLVDHNPAKAHQFIQNLSEVYRYILKSKDKDLVLLREEVAFMKAYASLMELRHEDAFQLNLGLEEKAYSEYLIPPVSMMVAVENAVKHNEVSRSHPLEVRIRQYGESLVVTNRISQRKTAAASTKTGLVNLDERFVKILGKKVGINQADGLFSLELPLLKLNK
ncbi:MAG: histidine kinase [Lewinellaceae bacterium]|nr:histidine kinase [Lewinella sp.]MCB9281778.1 histidine kinase [Lewinellaceae bacterium]